jgi:uncharacterized alkaline shock family protein YloU
VVTSYGVIGVDAGPLERLLGRLGLREPGIRVRLDRGLEIDLHLTVGYGLPIAEVARQVDSAVRYAIRRSLGHEVRRLTVHVDGLRYQPASVPPTREQPHDAPSAEALIEATAEATELDEVASTADAGEAVEAAGADRHDSQGTPRPRRRRPRASTPGSG